MKNELQSFTVWIVGSAVCVTSELQSSEFLAMCAQVMYTEVMIHLDPIWSSNLGGLARPFGTCLQHQVGDD